MTTDLAIETHGLSKRFGRRMAVEDLDIAVPTGAVAGFVGPNGSGKTTTMAMLLGLVAPTAGSATVLGKPLAQPSTYLRRLGALIEYPAFYPGLSGEDNLSVLATIGGYDRAQIPVLLDQAGLGSRGGDRFGSYSLGMKQRLGVAAALLGDPELVILDEPSNGLDPVGIREMRELVREISGDGRTVFVSSHVLAELEQVCDWLVMIDGGALLFQGPADELLKRGSASIICATEQTADVQRLHQTLGASGLPATIDGRRVVVGINSSDPQIAAAEVSRAATAQGIVLTELRCERMSLEEQYLALLKGGN
ncbi:MAG: ATP-binding cassette domain-containing protein [Dehalococcoidia bacterium]|nr:ATP-binding cassette domain-containing protein [Dehalococcoidia bacterium]